MELGFGEKFACRDRELETHDHQYFHAPTRLSWTPISMLQLGLTRYEMKLGFREQFTSQERELETHGHVQIGNQLGFHEHQFA